MWRIVWSFVSALVYRYTRTEPGFVFDQNMHNKLAAGSKVKLHHLLRPENVRRYIPINQREFFQSKTRTKYFSNTFIQLMYV